MKSVNPFKVGDAVSFKEDQKEDFMFKEDCFYVRAVFGHCVYLEYIVPEDAFDYSMPPLPRFTDDPWHYKAFELTK